MFAGRKVKVNPSTEIVEELCILKVGQRGINSAFFMKCFLSPLSSLEIQAAQVNSLLPIVGFKGQVMYQIKLRIIIKYYPTHENNDIFRFNISLNQCQFEAENAHFLHHLTWPDFLQNMKLRMQQCLHYFVLKQLYKHLFIYFYLFQFSVKIQLIDIS